MQVRGGALTRSMRSPLREWKRDMTQNKQRASVSLNISQTLSVRISKLRRSSSVLLMIGPPVLFILIFTLYPAILAIFLSFTNRDFGFPTWSFIGLENYQRLISWEYSSEILMNTALVVFCASALQISIGFLFAMALNQNWPYRGLVRGIAILPWIIPGIVIALLWQQIFNGSQLGIANTAIRALGFEQRAWLAEPSQALAIIIFVMVWRSFPLSLILLLGGLQSIPRELYEAASIDGATRWQAFRHITIPLVMPIILINLIWITAGNLNHLDIPFALTGGGPSYQTAVMSVALYDQAFQNLDAGFAASIATVMLLINIALTLTYVKLLKSKGGPA